MYLVVRILSVLVAPDDKVQHRPRHLKFHVERERLGLLQLNVLIWCGVDHGIEVAQGNET
jgi:hypothetical protein